jgi:hypothetical protein
MTGAGISGPQRSYTNNSVAGAWLIMLEETSAHVALNGTVRHRFEFSLELQDLEKSF